MTRSHRFYAKTRADEVDDGEYDDEETKKSSGFGCFFLTLLLLGAAGYGLYAKSDQVSQLDFSKYFKGGSVESEESPDPVAYEQLKTQLANERSQLQQAFINAETAAEQEAVLDDASVLLERMMPQLMRCWLGTPWDFNGTATIPGEGKIACGYYVSVIMRDAGFKVQRIKLAQQPSQRILRTFVPTKKDYWVSGGMPYDEYATRISGKYEGINIVGLDKHVAFVVVKNGELRFVHSGGLLRKVVDESKEDAHALKVSNYRVIGNLSRNRAMLQKWVLDDDFPTAK